MGDLVLGRARVACRGGRGSRRGRGVPAVLRGHAQALAARPAAPAEGPWTAYAFASEADDPMASGDEAVAVREWALGSVRLPGFSYFTCGLRLIF